jgi:HTH-type transcriptional regulator, competence development regulator
MVEILCSSYYTLLMNSFGSYIRARREALHASDRSMSVRQVAQRIGVEPAFLSKIERDVAPPPSEAKIVALAEALGEDPDLLLAMAGKVSSDLQAIIRKRPKLIGELLRQLKEQPDHAILSIVRQVTDGDW